MPGQLIPPAELAPPVPKDLTPAQRVELWFHLMDDCQTLLLAGLRMKIGPDGDLKQAYRDWYAERMEEHDRDMIRMMERFQERTQHHG